MRRFPLLVLALLPVLSPALAAQDKSSTAGDPSSRVARIGLLSGGVSFQPSGDTAWSAATLNYPMTMGDRIYADRGARAELQVGAVTVRAGDLADLTLTDLTDQLLQLGLTQGTIRLSVYQLDPGDSIEVDTPHGAMTVLEPGEYRIDAPPDDSAMTVSVADGRLQWTAGGVAQEVPAGQAIRVSGINPIQVASVAPPAPDAFDRWSDGRDAALKSSPSAKYVSRDIPGYEELDAAGSWRLDPVYGPVWFPGTVPPGWAPYRYGHWVWIEPWGWTWVEGERWGFAPFHYGRWAYLRGSWGWLPGPVVTRPCYAPALVVFVNGSSFGAQAWFPLGPDEPYYPWYHHDADYARRVNVTNLRRVTDPDRFTNVAYIDRIPYRNRGPGLTAVPTSGFEGRGPVAGRMLREPAQRFATAPVAPHPLVVPGTVSAAGGFPRPRPSTGHRPTWVTAPPPRTAHPVVPSQPLVVRREVPTPKPATAPVLITRRTPPPPSVPFPQRQKAMQPGDGRPLEPQQIDNLRAGRPAGPRREAAPAQPTRPGAQGQRGAPQRGTPQQGQRPAQRPEGRRRP